MSIACNCTECLCAPVSLVCWRMHVRRYACQTDKRKMIPDSERSSPTHTHKRDRKQKNQINFFCQAPPLRRTHTFNSFFLLINFTFQQYSQAVTNVTNNSQHVNNKRKI